MEYQEIINLIDNKIAEAVAQSYDDRIKKASKNSQQNNSETNQMRMINKYFKKVIYLQNKDKNNNTIVILIQ